MVIYWPAQVCESSPDWTGAGGSKGRLNMFCDLGEKKSEKITLDARLPSGECCGPCTCIHTWLYNIISNVISWGRAVLFLKDPIEAQVIQLEGLTWRYNIFSREDAPIITRHTHIHTHDPSYQRTRPALLGIFPLTGRQSRDSSTHALRSAWSWSGLDLKLISHFTLTMHSV